MKDASAATLLHWKAVASIVTGAYSITPGDALKLAPQAFKTVLQFLILLYVFNQ